MNILHSLHVSAIFVMVFAAAVDAAVLFISTDYVFDGTKPPYNEEDATNPLNDYGLSKLEGEKITLSVSERKFSCLQLYQGQILFAILTCLCYSVSICRFPH